MGQCLRIKYRHAYTILDVAIFCWIVAIAVFVGNTFYEINNFAGGMDAIYSMPPDFNQTSKVQIPSCVGYGLFVGALLLLGQTYYISIGLGVILVAMAVLFMVVVIILGLDWKAFGLGLIPNFPPGSANLILSLVSTTSIGFNLFLGSSLAEDAKTLGAAQRGIAFAVIAAFVISTLIMIIGSEVNYDATVTFSIQLMGELIEDTVGEVGLWFFSLGFMSAAISSMITVALGAAITADSVFTEEHPKEDISTSSMVSSPAIQAMPRWIYYGIMIVIVFIGAFVNCFQVDTSIVIALAQVVNGMLLPLFSFCVLLCINDPMFMGKQPQKWWANVLLVLGVTVTLFLAINTLISNIFASLLEENENIALYIAAGVAPIVMVVAIWATGLPTDLKESFRRSTLFHKCFSRTLNVYSS